MELLGKFGFGIETSLSRKAATYGLKMTGFVKMELAKRESKQHTVNMAV
jgi:hypothetical protein